MHKHFKLSDEDPTHIFDSHKKIVIFVAVFITLILCAVILLLLEKNNPTDNNKLIKNSPQQVELVKDYKQQAKQIINDFLTKRDLDEFQTQKNYQNLVNLTLENVLNLKVPVEFKDFHLKLVVLLDKEMQNIESKKLSNELEAEWNNLLNENSWINN